MPPAVKDLLDVVVPDVGTADVDPTSVTVLDAGDNNLSQRMSFVHFYLTAAVAMVETFEDSKFEESKRRNLLADQAAHEPVSTA